MPFWPIRLILLVLCPSAGLACGSASADPEVTVFAAASLTAPFTAAADAVPPLRLRYAFAGSQALVTQLLDGAPADVLATADEASMATAVAAGVVDAPTVFATNTIVIAVANGNPLHVRGLTDLDRPEVTVVLADPTVPVGAYARQVLAAAGVTVEPKSLELDTKATIGRVERGEVDAAIVYATDVAASRATEAVPVTEASGVHVRYPIAVVRATRHRHAAEAFVDAARSGAVHSELLAAGFGS